MLESGKKKKISKRNLSLMKSSNHELIKKLANVLEAVSLYKFTKEETEWFSRVESLRSRLLSSTEVIPAVYYRKAHRHTSRSSEEMKKEVEEASVAEFPSKKDEVKRSMISERQSQVFEDYVSSVQEKMKRDGKIKVYQDVLDSSLPEEEEQPTLPAGLNFPTG